jgi:hypothetical protein
MGAHFARALQVVNELRTQSVAAMRYVGRQAAVDRGQG